MSQLHEEPELFGDTKQLDYGISSLFANLNPLWHHYMAKSKRWGLSDAEHSLD